MKIFVILQCVIIAIAFHAWWPKIKLSYNAGKYSANLPLINLDDPTLASRLAFMSCNRQKSENPFWKILLDLKPNGMIWMGDNIYADFDGTSKDVLREVFKSFLIHPVKTIKAIFLRTERIFDAASTEDIRRGYETIREHPEYAAVLALPNLEFVTGVWDDHDYGENDGDKNYKFKDDSKKLLLEFLKIPPADPRHSQTHAGVYGLQHHTIKDPHSMSTHNLTIILLDVRYNKDPWGSEIGDLLGGQQWEWLGNVVKTSEADAHLIVSSIQVLPEGRFTECWHRFPQTRLRLLELISSNKLKNPIFISGDVHFGEILSFEYPIGFNKTQKFWEFTSSGMTHSIRRTPYGIGFLMDVIVRWLYPSNQTHLILNEYKGIYSGRNMGILDINYEALKWKYDFKILNSKREIVLNHLIDLD